MSARLLNLTLFVILSIFSSALYAISEETKADSDKAAAPVPEPTQFISKHRGNFNGVQVDYQVTAGETYLRDGDGEPKASIFSFAYVKEGIKNSSQRPVTFVWNGGPGSASLWLHMGSVGPKRIEVPSDAAYGGNPPYPILDAPETILDVTDLVFIDPVGTGYSRALGTHEGKDFWGLNQDATSMAEFIRQWLSDNGRWNSPRFLLGESFGTVRAAVVAKVLQDKMMISLNGLILVSQALDYQGSTPYVRDNIISSITYIPTIAATAWYHDKVQPKPADLEVFLQEARDFASDEYLPALFKGNQLNQTDRQHIVQRLAYFTGLSSEYIERADLRVNGHRFAKELLRAQGLTVGLLDARYRQDEIDDLAAGPASDVASNSISAAYKTALMSYLHSDLGVKWNRTYLAPADENLNDQWSWRPVAQDEYWEPTYVNVAHQLSSVLHSNPGLRVLVASGYYDLVTPFYDAEFTLNRHDIPADRIDYRYYHGGHMMYVNEPSRLQLLEDMRGFIQQQRHGR